MIKGCTLAVGLLLVISSCGTTAADARGPVHEAAITAESVMAHVRALPGDRAVGRPAHRRSQELIVERLEAMGLEPQVQPFEWAGAPGAEMANIELRLPGATSDAPIVIVCAHYDSVPHTGGADDNGSGVAALLELARRSAHRSLAKEVRLLWLDAEEIGLAGGRAWLEQVGETDLGRILGVINLETVAYLDRRPGSQKMPPGSQALHDPGDVGDFIFVIANQASADLAATVELGLTAETGAGFRVEVFDRLPGVGWIMPDSRRSDHASFWDRNVPAVLLTDTANFRNPHYHRPSDLPETLDGVG